MSWFKKKHPNIRVAEELVKADIPFICMPIMNDEDFEILKEEHNHRMQAIYDHFKKEYESIGRLNA